MAVIPGFAQAKTDDFNRANETPLLGNWSQHDDTGGGATLQLASNIVVLGATVADDITAWWTSWNNGNDQYSQVGATAGTTGAGSGVGVCVRRSPSAGTVTLYRVVVDSSGNYEISRFVSGVIGSLRTGTVSYVVGGLVGLAVVGTTLQFFYQGVQIGANITDGNIVSGLPGLSYSSVNSGSTFDNWDAGIPVLGPAKLVLRPAPFKPAFVRR